MGTHSNHATKPHGTTQSHRSRSAMLMGEVLDTA